MEMGNREMVERLKAQGLIRSVGVEKAFLRTPRELFVREQDLRHAYADYPLPIGFGQTISAPHMVAVMSELLDLKAKQKVLEIGSGSGYQAAVLSRLVKMVYTVEFSPGLAGFARANLQKTRIKNVRVIQGDGWLGYPEKKPYDRIVATCAVPEISEHWVRQLKAGGIVIAPVGGGFGQELVLGRKLGKGLETEGHGGCVFVPLRR